MSNPSLWKCSSQVGKEENVHQVGEMQLKALKIKVKITSCATGTLGEFSSPSRWFHGSNLNESGYAW